MENNNNEVKVLTVRIIVEIVENGWIVKDQDSNRYYIAKDKDEAIQRVLELINKIG